MIYAIVGRPRSGKSYEAVAYHVIPAIKKGRKVITNLALNIDFFVKVYGESVRDLIVMVDGELNHYGKLDRPFSKHEHYQDEWRNDDGVGPLYIVDEAHMVLPNRQLDSKILEFYSLHGHYGIDIILLTQNLRKIHRDIKDMIELTYYCAKNTALGSDKTYTKKVRVGATTETVNQEQRKYRKEIFPFYKSHTQSSKDVVEAAAKDIKPIWKHWTVWLSAIFLCGGAVIVYLNGGLFGFFASEPEASLEEPINVQTEDEPKEETKTEAKKSRKKDPLSGFKLYVSGEALQAAFDENKKPIRKLTFKNYYIDVYEKDFKMFTFTHHDLINIGYEFEVLSDCLFSATFGGHTRLITCGNYEEQEKQSDLFAAAPIGL
ncbi:assembly protein [Vibrio sp. SCSIO 43135]|uniref:zonular occludens toxin domain-containing protein n=1 Tax=Vibrio sp. SCSIO 43135 TaxID=2819096 RepID=UPI0020761690|nr:zonular occludens toxin domain-containing protein [Vibrio sp. SCSIO 43135]USD44064.1 assembly protein [Vibrio sp. SCSIO 43135]USD44073.1 assembly protein [Vibrio sp. SCSIO 43135]USD44082.1 assembly protein [Vibrio sp. SCSIO 43135]